MKKVAPLSLHPDNLSQWFARDPLQGGVIPDSALASLQAAMRSAHEAAEQVVALSEAVMGDKTQTPEANALRVRDAALRLGEQAAKAIDAARDKVREEIARVDAETAAPPPPRDPAGIQMQAEIRGRLVGMSAEARAEVIATAIRDGDDLVVGALLNAPAMLSGAKDGEREMRRHEWRQRRHPAEADRLRRLNSAVEAVERGGRALFSFTKEFAESSGVKLAEAAQKRAKDAETAAAATAAPAQ